ncbi:RidA family protein [SAR202 cluster bacterium AD-804-J14_MRT_500m]|nr:RidA family protein [SAR202 cluster bacterium AD-804-J14_MRT_500m]
MTRKTFFPDTLSKPSGFSPATRVGNIVFVSGQVGVDGNGIIAGADCGAQAEKCLSNIATALKDAGAELSDVAKITTFLVNMDDYSAYAAVRLKWFPSDGPASSTVGVNALVRPEFLIEIEAVAVLS